MRSDMEYGSQSGKILPELKKSPGSPTATGAQRWQIRFDDLKFEKKLGKGAFGEVWEGRYKKGKVAIKMYDFRGDLTEDQKADIVKEADLMEGLRSDYLVGFRGICWDQRYCLVMEYCEGGTLRARLNPPKPDISPLKQLDWAKQIGHGLYHLHSVGILHRDLKGENILLNKHEEAKIADFGLSVVKSNSKSSVEGAAGTLPWMAPELFRRNAKSSSATDIYSLGMVLWEIVSRQVPFADAESSTAIVAMVAAGERENLPKDCPKVFDIMIQACWNADPTKRPTAEKVGDEFEAALESLTSIPASVSESASPPEKKLESSRTPALVSLAELAKFEPSLPSARGVSVGVSSAGQPVSISQSESARAPALASLAKLAQFEPSLSTGSLQVVETPTEDKLLPLRDEAAAHFVPDFKICFEDLTLSKLLGQGGYGKVYVGEWKFNTVAIKQYAAGDDFSDSAKEEIRKEGMVMATVSMQSDYLVRLRGMVLEKPYYCLIMEYMPGGDLFHLLKSSQEMSWPMRYRIGLDITMGLHHLHESSILHRDLNSLNVLLDMNFRAKLTDFGLSTLKTSSGSSSRGFKGTVLWLAPELFNRGGKATTAADIYSLGMVLWELASRKIPFKEAATPQIAASWIKSGKRENFPESTPKEFKTLITDCWYQDPTQRLKASEVARRLDVLWKAEQKKTTLSEEPKKLILPSTTPPVTPMSQNSQSLLESKPVAKFVVDQKQVEKLLRLVAEGEQDQAEEMLKKDKGLLLAAGAVTDLSGREFKQITVFQYALWALDWHMWKMIQKYLPAEAQAEQFDALESKGTAHGKHFSLKPLIDALQTYVDNAGKVWDYDERADNHWKKVVGGAQRLLPAHVVNEYCHPKRSFYPCPEFKEDTLPRNQATDKGNWFTAKYNDGVLGEHFAVYREEIMCRGSRGDLLRRMEREKAVAQDIASLQFLSKTRTQQLDVLASQLKSSSSSLSLSTSLEESKKPLPSSTTAPLSQNIYTTLPAPKPVAKTVDEKALSQLLKYVAEGEQDKAEEMIKKDKNLLLVAGRVTDLSGREFKQITAFQYALWALDWHMWTMIQKYLPKEAQAEQSAALESKGTTHGKHFSLKPLTDALQTYVDNAEKVWKYDQRAKDHWSQVVGRIQKVLPTHVVNEYCRSDRAFYPCPTEWKSKLLRTCKAEWEIRDGSPIPKSTNGSWYVASYGGFGFNFAFSRGGSDGCAGRDWVAAKGTCFLNAQSDLNALQSLWKTRTEQLELLKSELSSAASHSQRLG